ncbi:hypothetical protein LCGC14_0684550 [marine sediment metagenome]|uniref:Uncharacterized protein n=1 Tax=marine sediment metagenome TaxID=412755 RepID=A0A0F9R7L6_9ZZZZ
MKDKLQVTLKIDEKFIKRDLEGIIIPGVLYYCDIPIENFNKDELINIIYLFSLSQQSNQQP